MRASTACLSPTNPGAMKWQATAAMAWVYLQMRPVVSTLYSTHMGPLAYLRRLVLIEAATVAPPNTATGRGVGCCEHLGARGKPDFVSECALPGTIICLKLAGLRLPERIYASTHYLAGVHDRHPSQQT
ncbi:hypothetical protein M441DRAFT_260868 [Trichoderma asperellum CBS 433.97]|uniref:Uncharacterized protein n=1 Tax=Trichoderma asperellum (strain ATCC 204424 / CBS 433.97 / NBRC 101777) TaxID=1042311 RepID=A0A2T3YZF0_TRIA4|nr:hypothetical protein M441DRAFT_260868 [Trichoderma asperellum CBS 433.97]PTB37927.1 hypothetical protein M441DRAFT_260868 [Trichoderma asperellum CBS 433.97]